MILGGEAGFVYSSIRLFVYSSIRLFVYSSIRLLMPQYFRGICMRHSERLRANCKKRD